MGLSFNMKCLVLELNACCTSGYERNLFKPVTRNVPLVLASGHAQLVIPLENSVSVYIQKRMLKHETQESNRLCNHCCIP